MSVANNIETVRRFYAAGPADDDSQRYRFASPTPAAASSRRGASPLTRGLSTPSSAPDPLAGQLGTSLAQSVKRVIGRKPMRSNPGRL